MAINKSGIFWGILLIGAGALALLEQMGAMQRFPEQVWVWVFALAGLLGLVNFAMSGWKRWGWLFPAGIFGGLAITTALAMLNVNSAAVSSPLFVGLLVPFAAAYLLDRTRNWWALIPGGVMLFLTLTTLLVDSAGGEWVGSLFLFMVAISFLMAYLNKRSRTWALLVAYVFGLLGIAPLMGSNEAAAPYYAVVLLLGIAAPFFFVYFRFPEKWWALIPASALTLIALIIIPAMAGWLPGENESGYAGAFLLAGLAGTFAVIWRRHSRAWAKVVTIMLGVLAVASLLFASQSQILWSVAIILAGVYLLFVSTRAKKV